MHGKSSRFYFPHILIVLVVGSTAIFGFWLWARHEKNSADPSPTKGTTQSDNLQLSGVNKQISAPTADDDPKEGPAAFIADSDADSPKDDPAAEGWHTEVFADVAKHRIKDLLKLAAQKPATIRKKCTNIVAKDFHGQAILPNNLEQVYQGPKLRIDRLPTATGDKEAEWTKAEKEHSLNDNDLSAQAFSDSVTNWAKAFESAKELRFQVKVVGVVLHESTATTVEDISVTARVPEGRIDQHAKWRTEWKLGSSGEPPTLTGLQVIDFEQVLVHEKDGELFAEISSALLGKDPSYAPVILRGYTQQLRRTQDARYQIFIGRSGLAIGDVNGDGLEDFYLTLESGLPNLLYLQQPDGTAKNVAHEWGVDWLENSPSAVFVDLDNDGDQDLATAIAGGIVISSNEGDHFEAKAFLPTADDTRSLSAADYDLDGKIDLFICGYQSSVRIEDPVQSFVLGNTRGSLYQDYNYGAPNDLFRNDGEWRFSNVNDEVGINVDNTRLSFAGAWGDYDRDGDMDLYVANDFAKNSLFRNDVVPSSEDGQVPKRKFTLQTETTGSIDQALGMSASWGDYNRDGWMDLYVGNMFSSAGQRITMQKKFKPHASKELRSTLKRFARGNTLMKNQGDGTFTDTSEQADVTMGRWAWSSPFADINNDGWEDLLVANGFITGDNPADL